ncbi:A disintegrin and metalloproteinase with thrombospondin motifs adt-2-like isoform X2 [Maniola hyperantus]|uniref:A disintegrin and metalloproteinase with thrombospondin motifs adt-2-like isoform X2 n=1 Tax=Aphantopus hyperantus TaxID=2795564 RepID=UPI0037486CA9
MRKGEDRGEQTFAKSGRIGFFRKYLAIPISVPKCSTISYVRVVVSNVATSRPRVNYVNDTQTVEISYRLLQYSDSSYVVTAKTVNKPYCREMRSTSSIKYLTQQNNNNNDITIKVMVHFDKFLTKKLVKEYKVKTRKKLKMITHRILEDARNYFKHPSLNQTVNFVLMDTRFLRDSKNLMGDENAREYLKNYCDWQAKKKVTAKTQYYSVLLTGMDIFHINNGKYVRTSSGRSYTRGACHAKKSCALIEWDPKLIGFLFAHEIGHSLGMRHDGPPHNRCREQTHIMATRYDPWHHPQTWSSCSLNTLKQFLNNSHLSWCVKNENERGVTFKYFQ